MAYAMISSYGKSGRSLSAAAALLRGVHSVYPLTSSERKHLLLLVSCRLACSVTLGAYSYQQDPGNEYLLLHAEPAWKALELVWGRARRKDTISGAIDRLFDAACDGAKGGNDETVIECSDIAIPDPDVVDLLSDVREAKKDPQSSLSCADQKTASPPAKKRKTEDDNERSAITFVTGNKKKLEEVVRILDTASAAKKESPSSDSSPSRHLPFKITNCKIDLPELQGDDPVVIAREKCALAAAKIGGPVITEDTSLCFTALKSLPGPYIKWFLDRLGLGGLNDMIQFSEDKSAYAQTVVAFCPGPGMDVEAFDGRTEGKIVPPRGCLDFGWDPIFEPDEGGGLTYAEMSKEGKDAISHRSRAFSKLREYFLREEEVVKRAIRTLGDRQGPQAENR
uniref:Inosine triphosphate pyrophosphatase n=1 Tax=Odontella aurita TaxID=265563 RepID=A0A7S4MHE7_9STRA|mmetsp:Transcript_21624/g.63485  ORF Transcript_21624/g.63485 Transcript_21624/m.63485 type:complete len:395 (+) Transcript_21624:1547-2731(+)